MTFGSELDDLKKAFLADADENLAAIEALVLMLESGPTDERTLNALFRAAHTLKGNAACMQYDAFTAVSHAAEELLDRIRSHETSFTREAANALLRSVDVLRRMAYAAVEESLDMPAEGLALIEDLQRAAVPSGASAAHDADVRPAASDAADVTANGAKSLRIELARLDDLLSLVGELAIASSRTERLIRDLPISDPDLEEAHERGQELLREIQTRVLSLRLVPAGPLFRQMARVVRDTAQALGKEVSLVTAGEEIEVDATMLDLLKDPLTHMLRNALDHGIESPEERTRAGKKESGEITLRTSRRGDEVLVELTDDGRGLDRERIAAQAVKQGLIASADALTERQIFALIFEPGFSTAEEVTSISGRGVGMDIVRKNVEALRGSIEIDSEAGLGTRIRIRLPLSIAIVPTFAVSVAGQTLLLPSSAVAECVEMRSTDTRRGAAVLNVRGEPLPFIRLRDALTLHGEAAERENVVVVTHGSQRVGLGVDAFLGEQQAVVKPLDAYLRPLKTFSGSTILGDGSVAFIVDVASLVNQLAKGELCCEN